MLEELEPELERVRGYRADVPEPDAATVAAARLELMELIAREPADVAGIAQSRGARHAGVADVPHPRGARPVRSRERLRKLQRRRRFVLAGGLAAVGVAVAGVLGFNTASAPQRALAAQMNQLAKIAASQSWSGIPGPGQYIYTESEGPTSTDAMGNDKECVVAQTDHRQIWIATDGSGAIDETRFDSHFTSAADAQTCAFFQITDASTENSTFRNRFPAGGLSLPTNDWSSLSTDPKTLLREVHRLDGGPNEPAEWMTNIADFMRESDAPPAIRAALYQATALVPGVKLLGSQTDPAGQTGLGVGFYQNGNLVSELIFDQQTAKLLGEESFDPSGKLNNWTAYLESKIVNSVPDYPLSSNGNQGVEPTTASGTTTSASAATTVTAAPTTNTSAG